MVCLCAGERPAQRAGESLAELQGPEVPADRSPHQAAEAGGAAGGGQGARETRAPRARRGRLLTAGGRPRGEAGDEAGPGAL